MSFARQPYASELVSGSPTRRAKRAWRPLVVLGVLVLVAVGCSDDDASPEASIETTVASTTTTTAAPATTTTAAPATTTTATPIEIPLPTEVTETHSIPGFGYSIDYSSGWTAETNGTFTQIAPTDEAFTRVAGEVGPAEGLGVGLLHQTAVSLGLDPENVTLDDVVEFNINAVGWADVRDLTEVEIFDSPAIRARVTGSEGREFIYYQGLKADTSELFLLGFGAPTSEILDEFLPTWDAMVESITATE